MRGALFDLDGVLVDTEGIYTEFWSDIDRRFPTGVADFAHIIKGSTLANILNAYFPDSETQQQIIDLLKVHEKQMQYSLFDGVANVLQDLRDKGFSMAIVTSSNRTKMTHLFAGLPELEKFMDVVITDEDITNSKPDPEGYILAANRLGIPTNQCYIFEDSLNGLKAARAAGGVVVGVATSNPHDIVAKMSDITVNTLADFKA